MVTTELNVLCLPLLPQSLPPAPPLPSRRTVLGACRSSCSSLFPSICSVSKSCRRTRTRCREAEPARAPSLSPPSGDTAAPPGTSSSSGGPFYLTSDHCLLTLLILFFKQKLSGPAISLLDTDPEKLKTVTDVGACIPEPAAGFTGAKRPRAVGWVDEHRRYLRTVATTASYSVGEPSKHRVK